MYDPSFYKTMDISVSLKQIQLFPPYISLTWQLFSFEEKSNLNPTVNTWVYKTPQPNFYGLSRHIKAKKIKCFHKYTFKRIRKEYKKIYSLTMLYTSYNNWKLHSLARVHLIIKLINNYPIPSNPYVANYWE